MFRKPCLSGWIQDIFETNSAFKYGVLPHESEARQTSAEFTAVSRNKKTQNLENKPIEIHNTRVETVENGTVKVLNVEVVVAPAEKVHLPLLQARPIDFTDPNINERRQHVQLSAAASCLRRLNVQSLNPPLSQLQEPIVQDMVTEEPSESTDQLENLVCAEKLRVVDDLNNDHYRLLRRDRKNLVLDSVDPLLAPHIIITPPTEYWSDFFIPSQNRVDPQWTWFLTVPPIHYGAHALSWTPSLISEPRWEISRKCHPDTLVVGHRRDGDKSSHPISVLNLTKFSKFVDSTSTERLIMYHVVTALQRRLCKASAYAASTKAKSFCTRYHTANYFSNIEKPFKWSDPAEPILLAASHHLGTTIIDSVNPFIAPHIIINAPPPQDPWVPWGNATNDPQDMGYGRYLTVPSRSLNYINCWDEEFFGEPDTSSAQQHPLELQEQDLTDSDDDDSDCTPPLTPLPDEDLAFFSEESDCTDDATFLLDHPSLLQGGLSSCGRTSPMKFTHSFAIDDDDDDDLPPFDDWYQSVVNRTQITV